MTAQIDEIAVEIEEPDSQALWYEEDSAQYSDDYSISEYELTSAPNDFNIMTIFNFIEARAIIIPEFQRNYVWDIKRASKLIESIIIGLPVPQIFLYEQDRNKFLVIDGQQRLMSIYYFVKQRFPRKEKRPELRQIFSEHGRIPDEIFNDDAYFTRFNLNLPGKLPNQRSKLDGLNYETLGEYRMAFDLRTIRNVIVKQVSPREDDSPIYEIFNRLNSGGVNLTPQEIRMSLYHSDFYKMLDRINIRTEWRRFVGIAEPDLHMKDLEFLLRGFAMLIGGDTYGSSMARFLNAFSKNAQKYPTSRVSYLETLFDSFLASCAHLDSGAFQTTTSRFSITLFESVFVAVCGAPYSHGALVSGRINPDSIARLRNDRLFQAAAERTTTSKANVTARLRRAQEIIQVA